MGLTQGRAHLLAVPLPGGQVLLREDPVQGALAPHMMQSSKGARLLGRVLCGGCLRGLQEDDDVLLIVLGVWQHHLPAERSLDMR